MQTSDRRLFAALCTRVAGATFLAVTLFTTFASAQSAATTPAEVFRQLNADRWVAREVSLADLGFKGPLVLGAPETRREVYLPVPAGVPLSDGEIKLNASYMRADGGRTTLVVSLDAYPVSSRPFPLEKGDASLVQGVDGSPRASGFVRLGIDWGTALGADWICTDGRTAGNVLRIEPDSRFTFGFDRRAIRDLTTAWGALPIRPVILVSSENLTSDAYDSAWRLGVALERAGKRGQIRALPKVGDVIDLDGVVIPAGLRGLPSFATLAQGGSHKVVGPSEIGALIALGSAGPFQADLIVADPLMTSSVAAALDALRDEIQAKAPEAVTAFMEWRSQSLDSLARPTASREIQLASMFGRPTIVVAADAGASAAGLFGAYWNRMAVSSSMVVQAAFEPLADKKAVSLKYLGGKPGSFDVLSHADWSATFDIGAVAADGRLPGKLVLDLAASPSAARTPPVASIFLNDILLGAKQMDADGKPERITATIPSYALAARNVLRVSFVRQLASDRCRETPEAYPVSVLPSSHLLLKDADPSNDFNGMVSRFARGSHVLVPGAYLSAASQSLPVVIRLAATTGVSPTNARFTAVSGALPAPGGPFLALELPFKTERRHITSSAGHVVMPGLRDKAMLDVTGLDGVGVLEIVKVSGDTGVLYTQAGAHGPPMDTPLLLAQGDVAVIGSTGVLTEINSNDPSGGGALAAEGRPWLLARGYWWMLPILAIVFMVSLMVLASRMRRRMAAERAAP